jgi:hypothetical protein
MSFTRFVVLIAYWPITATHLLADSRSRGSISATRHRRMRGANGQATTEYALILLGAALVGLLVVAWATAGGAAGRIGDLFDRVVDSVISRL